MYDFILRCLIYHTWHAPLLYQVGLIKYVIDGTYCNSVIGEALHYIKQLVTRHHVSYIHEEPQARMRVTWLNINDLQYRRSFQRTF